MRRLPAFLAGFALAGLELTVILLSAGRFRNPLFIMSFPLFACGMAGLTLSCRKKREPVPDDTASAPATTFTAASSASFQDESSPEAFASVPDIPAADSVPKNSAPLEARVYDEALPALFASIEDYLNKTSDPMSETLVKIKTAIADFLSGIHQSNNSFESMECTTKLYEGISQLRTHITDITNESSRSFMDISSESERLNVQMTSILELLRSISDVAERIHILSINASIESARAGVHGRGFKVIADEIQKLSRETQSLVMTIGSAVENSNEVFGALRKVMDSSRKKIDKIVSENSSTYGDISQVLERQLNEFRELYSDVFRFIGSLEVDMDTLSPIAMLHAIITQEIENLEKVTVDLLKLFEEKYREPDALAAACEDTESTARLRNRLTTSRELDALDAAIRKIGIQAKTDLKRNNTEIEFF